MFRTSWIAWRRCLRHNVALWLRLVEIATQMQGMIFVSTSAPLSQFPSRQSPLLSDHRIVSTYTTMVLNISSVVTLLDKVFPSESWMLTTIDAVARQVPISLLFSLCVDPPWAYAAFLDVDFRFMATSDLTNELLSPSAEPTLHDSYSYKLLDAVLNTLNDKNGEVQNMGVKWYSCFTTTRAKR